MAGRAKRQSPSEARPSFARAGSKKTRAASSGRTSHPKEGDGQLDISGFSFLQGSTLDNKT